MSLRTKLVLLTSGLGAALVAVAFLLVHFLFSDHVRRAAREDIASAEKTLEHSVGRSLESYRAQGRVVSDETVAKDALIRGAADLAYTYVDSVHDRTGSEYLLVRDLRGAVLADVRDPKAVGAVLDLGDAGATRLGARAGFVMIDGTLVVAAVIPITLRDRPLGTLLLGDALTPTKLREVQAGSSSAVTVVTLSGRPISTLDDAGAAEVSRATGTCDAGRTGRIDEVTLGGEPHLLAVEALSDIAGRPLGCIAVTRSLAAPLAELADVQRRLLLLGLAITALAIAGGWIVSGRVIRPIHHLTGAALRIAAGDLSQSALEHAGQDEVGQMADAFNRMLRSLRALTDAAERISAKDLTAHVDIGGHVADAFNRMIESQREVVRQISAASVLLAATGAQIYSAARQQESAAAHQSTGGDEVSRTMRALHASASRIAQSAQGVLADAEKTRDTTDGMARRIEELNAHAARIAELLELIREIADRSDLLALNASIEATRAGGRAFVLVAAEMRRLAERVTGSVADVKTLLADVRASGSATVAATDQARTLVASTADSARQITAATEQQRVATGQVLESMQHIASVLGESAASAQEVRSSATLLKKEADALAALVGQFRVD